MMTHVYIQTLSQYMVEYTETGGALIGMGRATWPFANLKVNKNVLELNATILGNLYFKPSDIISIEPYGVAFKSGVRINHTVDKYSKTVVFLTSNSSHVINQISQIGFLNNTEPIPDYIEKEIADKQLKGSFPLKISAVTIIVLVWNVLFFLDGVKFLQPQNGFPLGRGAEAAISFMLLTAVLMLIFDPIRKLILKEGRTINDVKIFLYFLIFICTVMLIGLMSTTFLKT